MIALALLAWVLVAIPAALLVCKGIAVADEHERPAAMPATIADIHEWSA